MNTRLTVKELKTYKPMFGTVSHNGGLWVLHYEYMGSSSRIHKIGYGTDVFHGFGGPVIRFDKANLDAVLESIRGLVKHISGYDREQEGKMWSLSEYLEYHRKLGIPVE